MKACYWDEKIEWELPDYYCWKLTVNGILLFAWVWASKVNIPWAYFNKSKILKSFSWEERELINQRLSIEYMSDDILKKNLKNPTDFIDSFKDGKYPNLKSVDTDWSINALIVVEWKIKLSNWYTPKWSNFNYVLVKDNTWYRIIFWENHSYLSAWKNVEYAWNLKFTQSWNISYLDNGSWHYKPSFDDENQKDKVINVMNERFGLNIDKSIFQSYKF